MFLTHALRAIYRVTSDALWKYVTLLLTGAPQVSTFITDASTNNFQLTSFGDTRPNNFNPYTPGYYSNYFDGSGDYFTVANNSALNLSGGDFTIEAWIYLTALPAVNGSSARTATITQYGSTTTNQGYEFNVDLTTNTLALGSIGVGTSVAASFTFALNTWYHVAVSRSSGTDRLFVNGASLTLTTNTFPNNSSPSGFLRIGAGRLFTFYDHDFPGYISNLRIVKGTGFYTASFTPPTAPLTAITNTSLLACQSNRFIDNSTNNFTLTRNGDVSISPFDPFVLSPTLRTYGSAYFDGTGDYLTAPSSAAFGFGTGDFTVECWVNTSTINTVIFDTRTAGTESGVFFIQSTTGFIGYFDNAVGSISGTSNVANSAWNHLAWTRSGTTFRMFVNGVQQYSGTNSGNFGTTRPAVIGSAYVPGSYFSGYISDLRVNKGTAVYTTAFTPPTVPLTAIANTSLLTLQTNQPINNSTFLDNSSLGNNITRSGNATQGSYSPYGGNWSTFFNGSSNLSYPVTAAFTGQTFTIEGWVNFTRYSPLYGSNSYACVLVGSANGTNGFEVWIGGTATSFVAIGFLARGGGTVTVNVSQSYTFALHTWYHVAVVKSGNSYTFYVNGTSIGTSTSAGTWTDVSPLYVGYIAVSGFNEWMYGYISNVRVVTGTAVYTSNFTPSTTPLTPITNTRLLTCADNRFIDNSPNRYAVTTTGSPSVQRFSPFSPVSSLPVSYGAYFDGNGDYLECGFSATSLSTNWTMECWFYCSSLPSAQVIFDCRPTNTNGAYPQLSISTSTQLVFYYNTNDNFISVSNVLNSWNHIALVKNSSTITVYLNGVSVYSTTNSNTALIAASRPRIGANGYTLANYFTGYISNFRIVNGTAVYTANFTPPTLPLTAIANTSLLTCQSPSLIDNSTNNFTITRNGDVRPVAQNPFGFTNALTTGYDVTTVSGSAYFDGTGDYLTVPYSSNFFLQNSYTIEAWVNPANVSTWKPIFTITAANTGGFGGLALVVGNAAAYAEVRPTTGGSISSITGGTIVANTWQHIALSVSSTSARLFLNGVQVGSTTTFPNFSFTPVGVAVGVNANLFGTSTDIFNGYISDLRVNKGTALYTGPFVPPVAPLTAVQNTVLLNNFTSAGVYDASMLSDLETVGGARVTTAQSKYSGSSLFFNGTTDYLFTPHSPSIDIGGGNFTVECWIYSTNISGLQYQNIFSKKITTGTTNVGYSFSIKMNGSVAVWNGSTEAATTGITLASNTWYHLAWVISGSTLRIFVNGTQYFSGTYSTSANTHPVTVGCGSYGGVFNDFVAGYIDDLRITKGAARYTANFTPPTAALPTF
jgi:hypothetical protein